MSTKSDSHHDASTYYIPHGSPWPILGSVALFTLMLGVVSYLNEWAGGWSFIPGALLLAIMFFGWFSTVIGENERGIYNLDVDKSFRNLHDAQVIQFAELNAYDVLCNEWIVFTKSTLPTEKDGE